MTTFNDVLIFSLLAGFSTLLGTALVFCCQSWVRENSMLLISFAAGVMLSISFLHLIPESLELFPGALLPVFIGFLLFYILQQIVMLHPCHDEHCHVHRLGLLSSIGLTIHSFLDGVAIAAGFEAGWSLGLLTTLAVLLHEVPEGITITGILIHSNASTKRIKVISAIVAMATPAGAIIAFFFLKNIAPSVLGILLALTAGSFIYLAASDLLPETHKVRHHANTVLFFVGVILIAFLGHLLH